MTDNESEQMNQQGSSLRWYHNKNGKPSTMRIITMIGTINGSFAVLVGAIVIIAAVVALFMQLPNAVQMGAQGVAYTGVGGAMIGGGELAKMSQAKSERGDV